MPGPVFLQGERVELRTMEEEDVDFLQTLVSDSRVRSSIMMAEPVNRQREREWVESQGEGDGYHFLVCVDGEPVGSVGLGETIDVWRTANLGYSIAPDHWGNGYATDAVDLACRYAFDERALEKVHATVYETNPASVRVLEKNGFQREGVLRKEAFVDGERIDVYRFGLLVDEWRNR